MQHVTYPRGPASQSRVSSTSTSSSSSATRARARLGVRRSARTRNRLLVLSLRLRAHRSSSRDSGRRDSRSLVTHNRPEQIQNRTELTRQYLIVASKD